MQYAIAWAVKGETSVVKWNGQVAIDLTVPAKKRKTIYDMIGAGDSVFCEMGSGAETLALIAQAKGAQVFRIPAYRLAKGMSRPERAHQMLQLSTETPDFFYPLTEWDPVALTLLVYSRMRKRVQRDRIAIERRLKMSREELELVGPFMVSPSRASVKDQLFELIRSDRMFEGVSEGEEDIERVVASIVKKHPMYTPLSKVKGMGPMIAGHIIGEIGDIRRFRSFSGLKSYAAYDVVDGKAPRRARGKVFAKNTRFFQALWRWSTLTITWDSEWREMYERRKLYEHERNAEMSDGQAHARACRYMVHKMLLRVVWNEWRRLYGLPTASR